MSCAPPPISEPETIAPAHTAAAPSSESLARLLRQCVWDEALLSGAGIPVVDSHIVSVGGGLGSFALVDFLRIAGVATSRISVLSGQSAPHEIFAALLRASQLGPEDRLRSDSSSRINNIWGWPGYLLDFRARHGGSRRVVNGYEPHDDVYEHLVRSPGRVVLRGAGITASRLLERLIHDRDQLGAQTEILHLFRNYVRGPSGPLWFRRRGGNGFAYQPFNFPKAAGGGQLRQRMLSLSGDERARLIKSMGGTTTAWRRGWQRQLARGRREGWYRAQAGVVTNIRLNRHGKLSLTLSRAEDSDCRVDADFLIDATGLEDCIERHALFADLLECSGASLNPLGRLDVEPSFEVRGTRSGAGRMYASGAATLGGALAPVDSFWGLTHAAVEICDDLDSLGACEFPGALRSITQWWRWVRNQRP